MPPEYALKLMENRENKFTHEAKKDIHERDRSHIIESYNTACELVNTYDWYEVKCIGSDSKIRTVDDIHDEIFEEVKKYL
jgi:dTMP kinase